jgi:hypothetical protein
MPQLSEAVIAKRALDAFNQKVDLRMATDRCTRTVAINKVIAAEPDLFASAKGPVYDTDDPRQIVTEGDVVKVVGPGDQAIGLDALGNQVRGSHGPNNSPGTGRPNFSSGGHANTDWLWDAGQHPASDGSNQGRDLANMASHPAVMKNWIGCAANIRIKFASNGQLQCRRTSTAARVGAKQCAAP